jgi:hypothetical protein
MYAKQSKRKKNGKNKNIDKRIVHVTPSPTPVRVAAPKGM